MASPTRGSTSTSLWRVQLSPGRPPTLHQLTEEELFYVLGGHAKVRLGDEETEVGAGDCIIVPPSTPFSLEAVGTSTFEAICCFPVGGRARLEDGHEFTPSWAE
jgi:mannose-6-phosphate isomerase-like protein (cupin superfamily)